MIIETGCGAAKNQIYVLLDEIDVLTACDLQTEKWEILCPLPQEFTGDKSLLMKSEEDGKNLYLILRENAQILNYDFDTHTFTKIRTIFEGKSNNNDYMTATVLDYEGRFIFLPFKDERIIVFHKLTHETAIYREWKQELLDGLKEIGLDFLFIRRDSACVIGDYIYTIVHCANQDIIVSIDSNNMKLYKIYRMNISGKLFGMELEDNTIWIQNIQTKGSRFICWNTQVNSIEKKTEFFSDINRRVVLLKCRKKYLCVGFMDGKFLLIDKRSCSKKILMEETFLCNIWNGETAIVGDRGFVKLLNLDDLNLRKIKISDEFMLKAFLRFVSEKEKKKEKKKEKRVGEIIFDTLCC